MNDKEYRELEKKVLLERYEKFKKDRNRAIPFKKVLDRLKEKYGLYFIALVILSATELRPCVG